MDPVDEVVGTRVDGIFGEEAESGHGSAAAGRKMNDGESIYALHLGRQVVRGGGAGDRDFRIFADENSELKRRKLDS